MSSIDFYIQVLKALEVIGASYMIVGSFGGYPFGINRATYDIDILVDLHENDFDALSAKFPLPRYYADPEMMRNSTEMGIMFNIIDTGEGVKADLVPLRREPEHRQAFERRIHCLFIATSGEKFEAWVAQPTDIIIGKLQAWDEGRSDKHPNDIHSMLVFDLSGFSDSRIDYEMISNQAAKWSDRGGRFYWRPVSESIDRTAEVIKTAMVGPWQQRYQFAAFHRWADTGHLPDSQTVCPLTMELHSHLGFID